MPTQQLAIVLAILSLLTVLPQQSGAIEIFGFKIFEPDEDDTIELIEPLPYEVSVRASPDLDTVNDAVTTSSRLVRNSGRPAPGSAGLLATARSDYERILDNLYELGRFGSVVSILINGREAADIPLADRIEEPVNIEIVVNSGMRYQFSKATLENAHPDTDVATLGFVQGATALSTVIRDVGLQAVDDWRAAGFPKAEIVVADVVAVHDERAIEAALVVEPGPPATFGDVEITGTERTDEEFIRYMADLGKGEPYNPKAVLDARDRLLRIEVFRSVEITEAETVDPDGALDFSIDLTDRALRRFGFGATASTNEGIGLEGFWLHRNLLGRAERLRVEGRIDGLGQAAIPGTELDYAAAISFIKPGVFTPDTDFNTSIGISLDNQPNFTTLAYEFDAGLSTIVTDEIDASIAFSLERSRVEDDLGLRTFTVIGSPATVTYDSRDVALDARSGLFVEGELFPFFEAESNEFALRSTVEGRTYFTPTAFGDVTFAGRALFGSITGVTFLEAPPQLLFFSGGGGSVRGFSFLSNGVTLDDGDVVGGLSLLEFSGEVRTRVTDTIGVVGFVDAGLVGADALPDFEEEFEVGVGAGLRIATGLGPLRFDVARGLDLEEEDPEITLFIGIGQAF